MQTEKQDPQTGIKKPFFKRRGIRTLVIIITVLLTIRVILPYFLLNYLNGKLSHMNGYRGHVQDLDIALYRGAYKVKNIYLNKVDSVSQQETPFFESRFIDLSVHWKALFQGKLAGELEFQDPHLRFTKDRVDAKQVARDTTDLRQLLDNFMPLSINRFEILNGVIQYIDSTSSPRVNIQMDNTHVLAENLTNVKDTSYLPAKVVATANVYGGILDLDMQLDPLASEPTFDMNVRLENTDLPKLNDFFKAYAKFDVNRGNFGLYSEIAAKEGNFVGYVKPLIKDLDIVGAEDNKDNILQKMWESIVGAAGVILRNQRHDQVATKIPLEGSFKDTRANIWYAILETLRNAFIQALHPSLDQEVNIKSVSSGPMAPTKQEQKKDEAKHEEESSKHKGFFGKLFKKKDKKADQPTEPADPGKQEKK